MFNFSVNQSHWVSDSTYIFNLGKNVPDMSKLEIALTSATIPYSWFNITSAQQNNTFSIIHPTTGGSTTIQIVLPDGGYELADINFAMRTALINAGYFIQNNTTLDQTVYCELRVNPSTYQFQFVSYPMPTSLPAGFTAGSAITFPVSSRGPQLIVPSTNITTRLGFPAGTYPVLAPTSLTTIGSSNVPQIADVLNVSIACDTVFNPYNTNSQILTSISPSSAKFATNINYQAPELIFAPQISGGRNALTFRLVDQNYRTINLKETNIVLNLCLREKD
jgi:hypothetical protein